MFESGSMQRNLLLPYRWQVEASRPRLLFRQLIESFARVSGWDQLVYLWELIVMVCKFLWGLLRLLGGG